MIISLLRKMLSKKMYQCILIGPWAKDDNGAFFKAALLSGSPGVGKYL